MPGRIAGRDRCCDIFSPAILGVGILFGLLAAQLPGVRAKSDALEALARATAETKAVGDALNTLQAQVTREQDRWKAAEAKLAERPTCEPPAPTVVEDAGSQTPRMGEAGRFLSGGYKVGR